MKTIQAKIGWLLLHIPEKTNNREYDYSEYDLVKIYIKFQNSEHLNIGNKSFAM